MGVLEIYIYVFTKICSFGLNAYLVYNIRLLPYSYVIFTHGWIQLIVNKYICLQGKLEDQGRLLMQGAFNVWGASKKETIRGLRFKPMQRHVFLYEKKIILCKKKDDPSHVERASYIYKNSIETNNIGLTETVKGDKRKFELWSHGRTEVFTFQVSRAFLACMYLNNNL